MKAYLFRCHPVYACRIHIFLHGVELDRREIDGLERKTRFIELAATEASCSLAL